MQSRFIPALAQTAPSRSPSWPSSAAAAASPPALIPAAALILSSRSAWARCLALTSSTALDHGPSVRASLLPTWTLMLLLPALFPSLSSSCPSSLK